MLPPADPDDDDPEIEEDDPPAKEAKRNGDQPAEEIDGVHL
jgi:hypothetical protein